MCVIICIYRLLCSVAGLSTIITDDIDFCFFLHLSILKIKNREVYPGVKISIVNEIVCTSRGGFCVNFKTDHIRERIWHVLGHLRG